MTKMHWQSQWHPFRSRKAKFLQCHPAALIAALLLALCSGGSINRRQFERICLYLQGWADEEVLLEILHRPP